MVTSTSCSARCRTAASWWSRYFSSSWRWWPAQPTRGMGWSGSKAKANFRDFKRARWPCSMAETRMAKARMAEADSPGRGDIGLPEATARNASALRARPQIRKGGARRGRRLRCASTSRWACWAATKFRSYGSMRPAANKALGSAATRAWRARPHCAATSASRRAHHGASQARRTTATGASAERATSAIAGLTRLLCRRALSCRHLQIAVRPPR